ncbi:MAG: serine/threonine-protein kinase [Polyangiaceae bacterium]
MSSSLAGVKPGDLLAQKYRVEQILGTGAMGVVVSAMHVDLHERRAIKFMLPSMLHDKEAVERFLREARSAVRLKSQHVARIHDIGHLENGAPYMVMELLQGNDLKRVLEHRGALPIQEAVGYMLQVCEGMAEAHALGIVHRDLKPANLFVTRGANNLACVKVLDFGIAKLLGNPDGVDITQTSNLMGTPLYMSPEQMRGAQHVDARSDVWALGAILYRLLTNRTPFEGDSVTQICAAVVADDPPPLTEVRPEVPPGLDAVVRRCLEKEPARRYPSVVEFARALLPFAAPAHPSAAAFAAGTHAYPEVPLPAPSGSGSHPNRVDADGSLAGSSSGASRTGKPGRRSNWRAIAGAAALLLAGGGVAAFLLLREHSSGARTARATAEPASTAHVEDTAIARGPASAEVRAAPLPSASPVASASSSAASSEPAPSGATAPSTHVVSAPPPAPTFVARAPGPPPPQPPAKPLPPAQPPVSYDERR